MTITEIEDIVAEAYQTGFLFGLEVNKQNVEDNNNNSDPNNSNSSV